MTTAPEISDALAEDREGTVIAVEVTAGAKTAVFPFGYNEWRKAIGVRVAAPALEGRANRAILKLVAESLDVPVSSVSLKSGATSSQKRVLVAGMSRQELLRRLEPLFLQ